MIELTPAHVIQAIHSDTECRVHCRYMFPCLLVRVNSSSLNEPWNINIINSYTMQLRPHSLIQNAIHVVCSCFSCLLAIVSDSLMNYRILTLCRCLSINSYTVQLRPHMYIQYSSSPLLFINITMYTPANESAKNLLFKVVNHVILSTHTQTHDHPPTNLCTYRCYGC